MHPDLTIAVARDRHLRRTAAVEERSGRLIVAATAVWRPPAVVPVTVAPVRLRVIPGGRPSGTRSTRRPAA